MLLLTMKNLDLELPFHHFWMDNFEMAENLLECHPCNQTVMVFVIYMYVLELMMSWNI